jgi:hypothetical protein
MGEEIELMICSKALPTIGPFFFSTQRPRVFQCRHQ